MRSSQVSRVRTLLVVTALALSAAPAAAQTNGSWNINTSGLNYSTVTNWNGGVPDAGGTATFGSAYGQTVGIAVNMDVSPTLSGIVFDTPFEYTLSGTGIINTTGTFTVNSASSGSTSPLTFAAGSTIASVIGGTGGLTKTGPGTLTLSNATNTFTGGVVVNQGFLRVTSGNNGTFGAAANTLTLDGGGLTASGTALTVTRPVVIGPNGGIVRTFIGLTFSGTVTGTGPLVRQVSNAAFSITGDASGFSGSVRNETGTFTLSGAGVLGGTSAIDLTGVLSLDNSGTNVNARTARGVLSRGAAVSVTGNAGVATATTVGNLTIEQGMTFINVTPNAAQATSISFAGLTRNNNAAVIFRGTSLGATPGANVGQVIFTSSPGTLVGGGGSPTTSTTASILPFAHGNTSAAATIGSTFVTWDAGSGRILPLDLTNGYTTNITTAGALDNVNLTAAAALGAATTVNALRLAPTVNSTLSGSPLTVESGAVLHTAAAAVQSVIAANLSAGSGRELILTSNSGGSATTGLSVPGVISGTGGLTLAGGGSITLSGANTYTGPTTIGNGLLVLPTGTVSNDGSPSLFGQDTSPVRFQSSSSVNTRIWTTGALVFNRDIQATVGGSAAFSLGTAGLSAGESFTLNGNLTLANPVNAFTGGYLFLEGGDSATEAVTINGNITGGGGLRAQFGSFNILNGTNNTFTGGALMGVSNNGVQSNAGLRPEVWQVGANDALGTGTVYVSTSAIAAAAAGNDFPTTVVPLLTAGGGPRSLANPIVLMSGLMTVGGTNNLTLTGPLTLNGNSVVTVESAAVNTTVSGAVSAGTLVKSGPGTLTLTNPANTYAGQTFVRQGVLSVSTLANGGVVSNIGQAPATAGYLFLAGGTLQYTGPAVTTNKLFTLMGGSSTLDASGTGPLQFTNTGAIPVTNLGTITGATLNANATVITFGNLLLTPQLAVGTTISNANIPIGTTITEIGPNFLRISNPTTAAGTTQTLTFTIPNRTLTLTGTNTGLNTLTPILANGGTSVTSVAKTGPGTWVLAGNNTYTGGTTVTAGILMVNGQTGTNSGTGTGPVTVNGGTFAGTGRAGGNVTVNDTGSLMGGTGGPTGTLSLGGTLTVDGGVTLRTAVADTNLGNAAADTTASLIAVAGAFDKNNGGAADLITIQLVGSDATFDFGQSYTVTVMTFASTSTLAQSDFTIGTPVGFSFIGMPSLSFTTTQLQVTFVPTPEPGTIAGLSAAVLAAGYWVRRRRAA